MSRWELFHAGEERARARIVEAPDEEVVRRLGIDGARDAREFEQRLDLRGEGGPSRSPRQVEWLDPERVACQQDRALLVIHEGQGEHADEAGKRGVPPFGKGLEDDLGIPGRGEVAAAGAEFVAQFVGVVDLAVVREREPPVARRHRLRGGGGEIAHGESLVQHGACGAVGIHVIRSAASLRVERDVLVLVGTAVDQARMKACRIGKDGSGPRGADDAEEATHGIRAGPPVQAPTPEVARVPTNAAVVVVTCSSCSAVSSG